MHSVRAHGPHGDETAGALTGARPLPLWVRQQEIKGRGLACVPGLNRGTAEPRCLDAGDLLIGRAPRALARYLRRQADSVDY